jgi:hypothetical protein
MCCWNQKKEIGVFFVRCSETLFFLIFTILCYYVLKACRCLHYKPYVVDLKLCFSMEVYSLLQVRKKQDRRRTYQHSLTYSVASVADPDPVLFCRIQIRKFHHQIRIGIQLW